MQPDLSVFVAGSGDGVLLRRFLGALHDTADHVGLEVFVAAPDGDAGWMADEFADVAFVAHGNDGPPGRVINEVLRRSRGRYFSLWDDSVVVADSCLAALVEFLDEVPEAGIVGPKLRDQRGQIQPVARAFPSLFSLLADSALPPGRPAAGWGEYASGEADWFAGPGMVISRCLLDEIGGVHPGLSGWFWQLELCRRAVRAGWHVHYRHEAQAVGSQRRWRAIMGGGGGGARRLWEWFLLMSRWPL